MANLNDSHVDVVQVHRANQFVCRDGDAIIINIAGSKPDTLSAALRRPIEFKGGKLEKYQVAFLSDYGYFSKYCSFACETVPRVTFAQAYNAAAKMRRPEFNALLAICLMCRFFERAHVADLRQAVQIALQVTRDAIIFAERYVRDRHVLRIEEVVTLDRLTYEQSLVDTLRHEGVFQEDGLCSVTSALYHGAYSTASPTGRRMLTRRSGPISLI